MSLDADSVPKRLVFVFQAVTIGARLAMSAF